MAAAAHDITHPGTIISRAVDGSYHIEKVEGIGVERTVLQLICVIAEPARQQLLAPGRPVARQLHEDRNQEVVGLLRGRPAHR
jgi:hypothetical protein